MNRGAAWLAAALVLLAARPARSAPPEGPSAPLAGDASEPATGPLRGQLREAGGSRAPVSGAVVLVVAAPEEARAGKAARVPLDPAAVDWLLRAESDADGRFELPAVPVGKVRVVVIAGGYARLEQFAEVTADRTRALALFVEADRSGTFRTEVASARERPVEIEPAYQLDAKQARRYAGVGDDPVLAALNLPGAARTPGGFGLLAFRGGDPTETGVYLDHHPIPRAFHIVPIASVVSPPMLDRVELSPGNYGPGYGSFAGGLVHLHSRPGGRTGVHGEAHVDLLDLGATLSAPIGEGSLHFGMRRSHVDGVIRLFERFAGPTNLLLPNYWDYLGRFDYPIAPGHSIGVRAIGAGDRLRGRGPERSGEDGYDSFDFAAGFHRFDFEYRYRSRDWDLLFTPSIRFDGSRLEQVSLVRRDAEVASLRVEAQTRVTPVLSMEFGADLVWEFWRRRERDSGALPLSEIVNDAAELSDEGFRGNSGRVGAWVAAALRFGDWQLTPSLRLNLFDYAERPVLRLDPRVELRGRVHPKVEYFARLGMYSIPRVIADGSSNASLFQQGGGFAGGVADIPPYLLQYFDPNVQGEVRDGNATASYAVQASTGVQAELPWQLELRGTLFWREVLPSEVSVGVAREDGSSVFRTRQFARQRALGAELLLRRSLARGLDGWVGYTLTWARTRVTDESDWQPAIFDQRHNLVLLLSAALPRGFRVGARFRLVSGNPDQPVLGTTIVGISNAGWNHIPLRGPIGTEYRPVFHQLDVRLDKVWTLRRTSVTAYLDIQNIYDNRYPEVYVYTTDWRERSELIGLPIFPSLGVQVGF